MSEISGEYLKTENGEMFSPVVAPETIIDSEGDEYSKFHNVIVYGTTGVTTFTSTSVEIGTYLIGKYYYINHENYFDIDNLSTNGVVIKKGGYYHIVGSIYYYGSNDSTLVGGYVTRSGTALGPSRAINTINSGNCYHIIRPQQYIWLEEGATVGLLAVVNGTKMTINFDVYTNLQITYMGV